MGSAIFYHSGLLVPSFWDERVRLFEVAFNLHEVSRTSVINYLAISGYGRLPIVYRGTVTVVCPGMKRPAIITPCAGVSRFKAVGSAGYSRKVSSMTAFRCGSSCKSCELRESISATSLCILSACCECFARQYRMKVSVGAVESLSNSASWTQRSIWGC
jgi:hypothetical protein